MSYYNEDDAPGGSNRRYVERASYHDREDIPGPSSAARPPPPAYGYGPGGSGPRASYNEPEILHAGPGPSGPVPIIVRPSAGGRPPGGPPPVILHTAPSPSSSSSSSSDEPPIRPPPPIRIVHGSGASGSPPRPSGPPPRPAGPRIRPIRREHPIRPPPRSRSRTPPRRRRSPRPVPEGTVTPAPPLNHPGKASVDHELDAIAEGNPKDSQKVRNSIVLCIYRRSKQTYDFRYVELRRNHKVNGSIGSEKVDVTDRALFRHMRNTYLTHLRGWPRRLFSFKALTTVRLLNYGHDQFFRPQQDDDLFPLRFMKIWRNPRQQLPHGSDEWVHWILGAKRLYEDFDMSIELVEDYVPERIVLFVGFGLLGIVALTAAWLVKGGDPGYVSGVMSFVLALVAAVVGLTGIWDWFDGGRSDEIRKHAAVTWPDGGPPEAFDLLPSAPGGRKT